MVNACDRLLRIPTSVYEEMINHAADVLPAEAIGLLGGARREVRRLIPLPNVLGARRCLADPYAQFRALRELSSEGLEAVAVYHSHPGGGIQPSIEDIRLARELPYFQLIIAIGRPHKSDIEVGAYTVTGDAIETVALELTPL